MDCRQFCSKKRAPPLRVGTAAVNTNQWPDAISIESLAGGQGRKKNTVAIGYPAGFNLQDEYAIAIDKNAGNQRA